MWSSYSYIPPSLLHLKEFLSKEWAVILRCCLYRKGSVGTKEIYITNDAATWVDVVISDSYGNARHHNSVYLLLHVFPVEPVRKVFPLATVHVCGAPQASPSGRARVESEWMCNDFMVLIIKNLLWSGLFACVQCACMYAVAARYVWVHFSISRVA